MNMFVNWFIQFSLFYTMLLYEKFSENDFDSIETGYTPTGKLGTFFKDTSNVDNLDTPQPLEENTFAFEGEAQKNQ